MKKDESRSYRIVNLNHRDDVIREITKCEERLTQLLHDQGEIALIAYVKPSK